VTSFEVGGKDTLGKEFKTKKDCELKEKMATKRKKDDKTGDDFDVDSSGTNLTVNDNRGN